MVNISPNNNCLGCCKQSCVIIALQGVTEGSFFLVWHLKPYIGVLELYNKLLDFIKVHGLEMGLNTARNCQPFPCLDSFAPFEIMALSFVRVERTGVYQREELAVAKNSEGTQK